MTINTVICDRNWEIETFFSKMTCCFKKKIELKFISVETVYGMCMLDSHVTTEPKERLHLYLQGQSELFVCYEIGKRHMVIMTVIRSVLWRY